MKEPAGKIPQTLERTLALSFRYLPTNLISRVWGGFTRTSFSRRFIRPFAALAGVAVAEAEKAPEEYGSLADFFVRRLRPGSRPIDGGPDTIVCPADGSISAAGVCEAGQLIQAKGMEYDLFSLLRDSPMTRELTGGSYLTVYLSPQDYHRVHAPLDMEITGLGYMPGVLLPVNPPSTRWVPDLYTQNERVMIYARGRAGSMAVVMIGAHCVGRIRLYFHELVSNQRGAGPRRLNFDPPLRVAKGDELGAFEMGSTVVLLFSRRRVSLEPLFAGALVRVGQSIGKVEEPSAKEEAR